MFVVEFCNPKLTMSFDTYKEYDTVQSYDGTDKNVARNKRFMGSWEDDLAVKNIGCSSRGSRFNSQHPHGRSQPSLTPVPGGLTPSSGLL